MTQLLEKALAEVQKLTDPDCGDDSGRTRGRTAVGPSFCPVPGAARASGRPCPPGHSRGTGEKRRDRRTVNSRVTEDFLACFAVLPEAIKSQARRAYRRWRQNPSHPALHSNECMIGSPSTRFESALVGESWACWRATRSPGFGLAPTRSTTGCLNGCNARRMLQSSGGSARRRCRNHGLGFDERSRARGPSPIRTGVVRRRPGGANAGASGLPLNGLVRASALSNLRIGVGWLGSSHEDEWRAPSSCHWGLAALDPRHPHI